MPLSPRGERLLFITGSNAAFFNSLLICLQSFSDRIPGCRLLVCDYGLTPQQRQFLAELGQLLLAPPDIDPAEDVFRCKAALLRYLRYGGVDLANFDAIVWLDGDLTLMNVGVDDFLAVTTAMTANNAVIAACGEPSGHNIGQMAVLFSDPAIMRPFAEAIALANLDPALPYLSTGLFFCRSGEFLQRWDQQTQETAHHPLFEQNMFNLVLHRDQCPFLNLDCEAWQAQGASLDKVRLQPTPGGQRSAAIGEKNILTLHTTSPMPQHLLTIRGRLVVGPLQVEGIFKLLFAEPLRLHQLEVLATFVHRYGEALLRLGLCRPADTPADGFAFTGVPA